MASSKIRCGVAGVGSLGQHHARIYAGMPGAELTGIFETSDARAAEICAKFNCRRFGSIEELGEACDAVSVVVPTDRHAEVALPLLARKTHLLIEKPLCASLGEAERVLSAAQANGCIVQVGHIEHFNPVMSFLEKQIDEPRYLTAERLAPYQPRGTEVGVVLDLEHPFHAVQDWIAPAPIVATDDGPPAMGDRGWLMHVDHKGIVVTHVGFTPTTFADRGWGLVVHVMEAAGHAARGKLRFFRNPTWGRQCDFHGEAVVDLSVDGDAVLLDLMPNEMARIEVSFG